jgi:multicomponent Na+:H+ antiporter subunit E
MMRRLPYLAYLLIVWVALWGEVSLANIASGLLVAGGLVLAFPAAGPGPVGAFRPLKALRFVAHFLYKLFEANVVVAWEVITPNNEGINEGIVEVPVTGASDSVLTLVANATSLTPGTITLEVRREPATLYVHVLHLRSIEDTRRGVLKLERMALEAFGSDESIEEAARLRAALGFDTRKGALDSPMPRSGPTSPLHDPGTGDGRC